MKHQRIKKSWIAFACSIFLTMAGFGLADEPRDIASDTWVATDAIGRSLPLAEEVGPPRAGKFVGAFYFLWLGESGEEGPFDISRILAHDATLLGKPQSPPWGPMLAPHHWGESIFGYYRSNDESVLRKHAQMLTDAGVDMIVFDVTNQATYPRSWKALSRVFEQVKREGNRVPQIAFLCPFWEPAKVVRELWDDLYSRELHQDLWFRWEGKPLILADPDRIGGQQEQGRRVSPVRLEPGHTLGLTLTMDRPVRAVAAAAPTWAHRDSAVTLSLRREGQQGERVASRRFEAVEDNGWLRLELNPPLPPGTYQLEMSDPRGQVGWWSDPRSRGTGKSGQALLDSARVAGTRTFRVEPVDDQLDQIRHFFTFRKPQPDYFAGPTGPRQWSWLEVYPQHAFYREAGVAEEVAVGVAQNAADGKLSVFTYPRAHGRSFHDGHEPGPEGRDGSGQNFAEQWRRALQLDPAFLFVTNWNEWIAGRFSPANMPLHGTGPVTFVDEFDAEFSRDVEPMKGGHGDNYLYQMAAGIRRFKGARPIPPIEPRPIAIDGNLDDWASVQPEFRDTIGDPVDRDHAGWGRRLHYTNRTGRNDIVSSKVSLDARSVFFLARTRGKLTSPDGPNWMLLFLDTDHNAKTGWLGYDFVVNRTIRDASTTTLERNIGGRYEWGAPIAIPFRKSSDAIELAIPRTALGLHTLPAMFDFKWADGIQQSGEWSDFTINGDAAPNDRYNFRARLGKDGDSRKSHR